jgi:hypothetical protein
MSGVTYLCFFDDGEYKPFACVDLEEAEITILLAALADEFDRIEQIVENNLPNSASWGFQRRPIEPVRESEWLRLYPSSLLRVRADWRKRQVSFGQVDARVWNERRDASKDTHPGPVDWDYRAHQWTVDFVRELVDLRQVKTQRKHDAIFRIQAYDDDAEQLVLFDATNCQHWGDGWSPDSIPFDELAEYETLATENLYHHPTGNWTLLTQKHTWEGSSPRVHARRLTDDEATRWLLLRHYDLPVEIENHCAEVPFKPDSPSGMIRTDEPSPDSDEGNQAQQLRPTPGDLQTASLTAQRLLQEAREVVKLSERHDPATQREIVHLLCLLDSRTKGSHELLALFFGAMFGHGVPCVLKGGPTDEHGRPTGVGGSAHEAALTLAQWFAEAVWDAVGGQAAKTYYHGRRSSTTDIETLMWFCIEPLTKTLTGELRLSPEHCYSKKPVLCAAVSSAWQKIGKCELLYGPASARIVSNHDKDAGQLADLLTTLIENERVAVLSKLPAVASPGTTQTKSPGPNIPFWNADLCELHYNGQVVRDIRRTAVKPIRLLEAFQEERWPRRIFNPLPPTADLREAVRTLNAKLTLIKFECDGSGEGITWRPLN